MSTANLKPAPALPAARLAGPVLASVSGALVASSTLLPWIEMHYVLPRAHGTYLESGVEFLQGRLALGLAIVTIGVGLITLRAAPARPLGTLWVAFATALVLALVGDQLRAGVAGWGLIVALLGALVGLAAVALGWPGRRGQALLLLAGTALLAAAGFVAAGVVVPISLPTF